MRMPEAQKALKKILVEEKLSNVPLMVLANKKDLPNCMTIREVNVNVFILIIFKDVVGPLHTFILNLFFLKCE